MDQFRQTLNEEVRKEKLKREAITYVLNSEDPDEKKLEFFKALPISLKNFIAGENGGADAIDVTLEAVSDTERANERLDHFLALIQEHDGKDYYLGSHNDPDYEKTADEAVQELDDYDFDRLRDCAVERLELLDKVKQLEKNVMTLRAAMEWLVNYPDLPHPPLDAPTEEWYTFLKINS